MSHLNRLPTRSNLTCENTPRPDTPTTRTSRGSGMSSSSRYCPEETWSRAGAAVFPSIHLPQSSDPDALFICDYRTSCACNRCNSARQDTLVPGRCGGHGRPSAYPDGIIVKLTLTVSC